MEQGSAQPGWPDISLIDPARNVPIAPLEARKLGSPELKNALHQLSAHSDGAGKTARVMVLTDGDTWSFHRPGSTDAMKPLAQVQISQDKPEDAATTLTRALRPTSIRNGKMDRELGQAAYTPGAAPDHRLETCCVLDTETTGFSAERDKIIKFGAIKVVNGKEIDSFQTFINPGRPIPKNVVDITHIDDSMVRNAPRFEQVKGRIEEFIRDWPIIAHNAGFDRRMLEGHGVKTDGQQWFDTLRLSRRIYQESDSHSLENLCKRLGIFEEGNHRADFDARLTGKAFALMLQHSASLSDDKRDSLIRETSRRGHDAEGGLLVAASQQKSGTFGGNTSFSQPKKQYKPGITRTSGSRKRSIGVK